MTEEIIRAEAEKVCAFSDLFLGVMIIPLIYIIWKTKSRKQIQKSWWVAFFCCLSASSLLGFAAHYLFNSGVVNRIIWFVLYPLMFECVNCFTVSAYGALKEEKVTGKSIAVIHAISGICLAISVFLWAVCDVDSIKPLAVFNGIIALCGFAFIFKKALKSGATGERLIFTSFLPLLVSGYFEIERKTVIHFIWYMDYNTLCHIGIIFGVALMFFAARKILKSDVL